MPSRRRMPAAPTSTATRRSEPLDDRRGCTSLTRTTRRPSMSTICLSSRSSLEQDLVRRWRNLLMSSVGRREARAGRVDRIDRRPGQEDLAPVGAHHEAGDGRVALADCDDEIRDLADRLAARVANGSADDLTQVEHAITSRGWSSRQRCSRLYRANTLLTDGTDRYSSSRRLVRRSYCIRCPRLEKVLSGFEPVPDRAHAVALVAGVDLGEYISHVLPNSTRPAVRHARARRSVTRRNRAIHI